ncbi:MAG TPA: 50S ribosomal protein L29 [Patescibacteria group bacterium]
MKRAEHIAQLGKQSLVDIKKDIHELEKKIQAHKLAISFGKAKDVRTLRNYKRDLARSLTIANQKLVTMSVDTQGSEK